jgi:hypothetical protein
MQVDGICGHCLTDGKRVFGLGTPINEKKKRIQFGVCVFLIRLLDEGTEVC